TATRLMPSAPPSGTSGSRRRAQPSRRASRASLRSPPRARTRLRRSSRARRRGTRLPAGGRHTRSPALRSRGRASHSSRSALPTRAGGSVARPQPAQSPVFVIVAPPTSTASPAAPAAITAPSRTPASRAAGTLVRGRQPRYAHDRRSSTRPTSHVASAKPTAPESELHASDQAGPGSGPMRDTAQPEAPPATPNDAIHATAAPVRFARSGNETRPAIGAR